MLPPTSNRETSSPVGALPRRPSQQSQLSEMAKNVILNKAGSRPTDDSPDLEEVSMPAPVTHSMRPPTSAPSRPLGLKLPEIRPPPSQNLLNPSNAIGHTLSDTPISTAPTSPQMYAEATNLKAFANLSQ